MNMHVLGFFFYIMGTFHFVFIEKTYDFAHIIQGLEEHTLDVLFEVLIFLPLII